VRLIHPSLPVAFLSLLSVDLPAQVPDTVALPPIVVTAARVPIAASAAPASITVIAGDALRAQGITTVADALRLVPGVTIVATGSFGGQTSLFLRGGESDYVKVLVDGVPQNQPGGFFDFANLGTENVDRIEVVRGPVSVLYGSDAVTGVVQVFTRSGAGPATGRLEFGVGRYGAAWGEGSVSGGSALLQYSVAVARHTATGIYSFNNEYRRDMAGVRLQLHPDARTNAQLSARYVDGVFHFPTDFVGVPSDSDQHTSDRGPALALDLIRSLSTRVDAHLSAAYHRQESRYDDGQDSPGDTSLFCCAHSRDVLRRLVLGARADVRLPGRAVLTTGVELERQRQGGTTLDTVRHNRALYAQALVGAGGALSLTLGGRVDENQQFGRHVTGQVGAVWRLLGSTRLRVLAGSGFKEPSLFESFASGFARGNSRLRPERSTSWQVGAERALVQGRVVLSATYFNQRFRDLIQYSPVPVGPDRVSYVNVGDATANGVELSTNATLASGVTLEANYTALRSRDLATGNRLQRRPSHTGGVRLGVGSGARGRFTLAARLTGDRDDQDFATFPATPVRLPAHVVVDASVAYRVISAQAGRPGLLLNGRITNLLDARYQEVTNFRTPRRALFLGASLAIGP
jgi:vitamin B12 transporter